MMARYSALPCGGLIDSEDYTMFVNGVQVMVDDIFYEILMLFLPEHAAGVLTEYLRQKQ